MTMLSPSIIRALPADVGSRYDDAIAVDHPGLAGDAAMGPGRQLVVRMPDGMNDERAHQQDDQQPRP
jgi:hypothetical protein